MKFKPINSDYFSTILDRLTRFEPAYIRYKRVIDDILSKFYLGDNIKNLSFNEQIDLAVQIFNSSIEANNDYYINDILTKLEEKYFSFNETSYQYLSARFNLSAMIDKIKINENSPKNLIWLKNIYKNKKDIISLREENSLLYPIEKIIICEGQTEYVLLETIFKLFGVDINSKGYLILQAGGKNQVARKYYQMLEYTKIPFFILLDKDAQATSELIKPKLRAKDELYLINCGEFEDIIPKNILQKTINYIHCNEYNCIFDDFLDDCSMVENLENIYKKYGFGEFKKAKFAQYLKEYIEKNCTNGDFINSEIVEIINALN